MKQFTVHGFRRKFFRNLNKPKQHDGRYIDCLIDEDDNELQELNSDIYNTLPRISVPEHEFEEIVSDLPPFEDLPITGLAWSDVNKPTKFIVECFALTANLNNFYV